MPLTDKKRITNDRYLSKFATKSIRIPKEIEEDLNTAAAHAGESVDGLVAALRLAADDFRQAAPPRDDLSLLGVEFIRPKA